MPIIDPPQAITVDADHLNTIVTLLRVAHHLQGPPFRREVIAAAGRLKESLLIPRILGNPTVEVGAEDVWWVAGAASHLGNDQGHHPEGPLFTAVDHLEDALDEQAPRTGHGMATALEAEHILEGTALTEDDQ